MLTSCWQVQSLKGKLYQVESDNDKTSPVVTPLYSQWHYESLDRCSVSEDALFAFDIPNKVDLWDRIRDGFQLPDDANNRIQQELAWLNRHPTYMTRVSQRSEPFLYFIVDELDRRNMPLEFALLPIVESAYDPFAYSHGRAAGMWQIIPSTGKYLGLKQNWWYDGRRDVTAATHAALDYLEKLHNRYDDWILALAAYNSGTGNVNKAIRYNKKKGRPLHYWALNLPKETEAYVPRLLALKELVLRPDIYKANIVSVTNEPYFRAVDTGSQIDLAYAAELAGMSIDDLYRLNPGFNRWATDPDGPHRLLIPLGKADLFEQKIQALPDEKRVAWQRYKVRSGDTLSTIAQKMRTTTEHIKLANNLSHSRIRVGQALLVPIASKNAQDYSLSSTQRLAKVQSRGKGERINYVVKSGDSFWTIGKRYGVSVRQLAKWNGLAPRDTLRVGQKLAIWKKPRGGNYSKNPVVRKVAYQVRKGDSLARIANKFNVQLQDILDWNTVNPKKYLKPGQRLTLYVDVTQVSH